MNQELKDQFYKECGQWCGDVHEEIAEWWLKKLGEREEQIRHDHEILVNTILEK